MAQVYIMSLLSEILSSKVRAEIFRLLFGMGLTELHMRELERSSGFAIGTIQTELKKLVRLELVSSRRDGNRLYYRANLDHPIYPEVRSLVLKTVGLADKLCALLEKSEDIALAFIFGSVASGTESASSDIDLMIIGGIGLRSVTGLLSGAGLVIGRELNPYVIGVEEFVKRRNEKEHFISSVLESPKIFVKGTADDLDKLG
jgi:uncharacterized protein